MPFFSRTAHAAKGFYYTERLVWQVVVPQAAQSPGWRHISVGARHPMLTKPILTSPHKIYNLLTAKRQMLSDIAG